MERFSEKIDGVPGSRSYRGWKVSLMGVEYLPWFSRANKAEIHRVTSSSCALMLLVSILTLWLNCDIMFRKVFQTKIHKNIW